MCAHNNNKKDAMIIPDLLYILWMGWRHGASPAGVSNWSATTVTA